MAQPPPTAAPARRVVVGTAVPFVGHLLPLRRLTVADVLDGAYRLFRAVLAPAVLIVLVIMGPLQLVTNLILDRVAPGIVGGGITGLIDLDPMAATGSEVALLSTTLASGLLGTVLSLIAAAAVTAMILAVDRGEEPGLAASLRAALQVLLSVLVASVLLGILAGAVFVGVSLLSVIVALIPILGFIFLLLFFLPVLLVGTLGVLALLSLVVPVAVVERTGPLATVSRTLWVFTRAPARIVWISLLLGIVVAVLSLAVQLPFLLVSEVVGTAGWAIESVGEVTGQLLSVPVTAAAALLVYLDVRVRVEGLDLRVRARDLGQPGLPAGGVRQGGVSPPGGSSAGGRGP